MESSRRRFRTGRWPGRRNSVTMTPMTRLLGIVISLFVAGFVLAGIVWLVWWLVVVAAVVGVAGLVWRAVTQR